MLNIKEGAINWIGRNFSQDLVNGRVSINGEVGKLLQASKQGLSEENE